MAEKRIERRGIQGALDSIELYGRTVATRVFGGARRTYYEYLKSTKPRLNIDLPHCLKIIERVQAIADGETQFQIIITPPRHGKTTLGTENAVLYMAEAHPGCSIMVLAHTQQRAIKVSKDIRRLAQEEQTLDESSTALENWRFKNGSEVIFFGANQGIHGYNADFIFVDDPIADSDQAESALERDRIWMWWNSDVLLRLQDHTAIMFIYTTAHYDDIGQRIIKQSEFNWNILRMPAESEGEGDPLGRPEGEFLSVRPENEKRHPNKLPTGLFRKSHYLRMKSELLKNRPAVWWGHYQCRPGAPTGTTIYPGRIHIIDEADIISIGRQNRSYDFASTTNVRNDRTAGAKGGVGSFRCTDGTVLENKMIFTDILFGRWDPGARDDKVIETAEGDGHRTSIRIPQDPGEAGVRVVASLSPRLAGFSVQFKRPLSEKKRSRWTT